MYDRKNSNKSPNKYNNISYYNKYYDVKGMWNNYQNHNNNNNINYHGSLNNDLKSDEQQSNNFERKVT